MHRHLLEEARELLKEVMLCLGEEFAIYIENLKQWDLQPHHSKSQ